MRRAAALAALLAACGDERPVVGPSTLNRCTRDADCRAGTCDLARGVCVSPARPEVFFRVVPPAARGASAAAALSSARFIRSGESVDLTLRPWRTVYGTVGVPASADGRDAPTPVAATVRFEPSDAPGMIAPVEAVSQLTPLPAFAGQTSPHTWAATLYDGAFDVVVRPARALRATVPPRFERRFDVRSETAFQRFDIVYPSTYTRWQGVVRDRAGDPVAGVVVRAVDPTRGDEEVSTVAVTNAAGAFSVAMAPGAPLDWVLRLTSDVNAWGGLVVDVPRAVCVRLDPTGREVELALPLDAGLPRAASAPTTAPPCRGCVRVSASVEGRSATGVSRPVRGAVVSLRQRIALAEGDLAPDTTARFEDRVETDVDGAFTTWLPAGDYEAVIEPQREEYANATTLSFRVRGDVAAQQGRVFTVDQRIPVEGRVLTAAGAPVRDARVRAVPFAAAAPDHACLADPAVRALARYARVDEATTGPDGAYRLDVDPGLYMLVVEPPRSAGFATDLVAVQCVASRVRALDLPLAAPVEVRGVVRDAQGRPVSGADVEAIARVGASGARGVTFRVARVTTDASGAYALLLPPTAMGAR